MSVRLSTATMLVAPAFAQHDHFADEHPRLAASVGYSRALGAEGHRDHGVWPLVSPMLVSEVSWNAGADIRATSVITAGIRASGGRAGWRAGEVDSSFELQRGVAGDPFTLRGVVSTALSF